MAQEFRLPDLGEGITEGQIVRILCKKGDAITEDQTIMEVETDKAAVEIPSPFAGVASEILVSEGQTVAVGEVLLKIEETNGSSSSGAASKPASEAPAKDASPQKSEAPKPAPQAAASPSPSQATGASGATRTRASAAPAIRKLAREMGVDIDSLNGSGPGGRVLREDVESAAAGGSPAPSRTAQSAQPMPATPPPAAAALAEPPVIEGTPGQDNWGAIIKSPLTQIRKTIARQMSKSVSTIPHVTQTDEIDITLLDAMRHELRGEDGSGPRVTMMAFILRTLCHCLRTHPVFNASFDDEREEIIYKQYVNIGIAVDSPRGLVVPVIRDADKLSVLGLSHELSKIAQKVRDVQFGIEDLRGGTFTITNYGAIGGIYGTPIINHPEVAILGVGRTQERLHLEDEELQTRLYMPISLSFDHRAADGAQAARFMNDIVAHLSNPALLMIK
ncbi:MAG: 2-oxo acid dehydrogenase subunit E2 [Phycisphaerales bacterium]|nr:2-oxo acid dehydrogenase subunit E2 [Phycisphaerales bacterium]